MRWAGVLASGLSRPAKHAALDGSATTECKADELDAAVLGEEEEDEEVGNAIVLRCAVLLCDGPKGASIAALACSEAGRAAKPVEGQCHCYFARRSRHLTQTGCPILPFSVFGEDTRIRPEGG